MAHSLRFRASLATALLFAGSHASSQSTLYTVDGPAPFATLGRSLDAAGDVNGDGLPDWIAGSSDGARVHSGVDGALLHDFPAPPGNTLFGWAVAGAGDIDRDGFADLLVGAQLDDWSFPSAGRAWLLSGANGGVIRTHDGGAPSAFFGSSLAGLPDVDGDGQPDYAVGAPGERAVRVYSGSDGGLVVALFGPELGFGCDIDSAGDVDGDGIGDIIVGFLESGGGARVLSCPGGAVVHEVHGAALGLELGSGFGEQVAGLGDLDGDGRSEFAVSSKFERSGTGLVRTFTGATGTLLRTVAGPRVGLRFGSSIASAGDVDADGVPDMIVGAPSIQGSLRGSLINNEPTIAQVFSGADGHLLYTYGGAFSIDLFGTSVAGIGDVDGDGHDDLAISAVLADVSANQAGSVRVVGGAGCPQPRRYCESLPHSYFNQNARIGSLGSLSIAENDLTLYAVDVGPGRIGAFRHGTAPLQIPAGDGLLCIGGAGGVLGVVPSNGAGIAILELQAATTPSFIPGQTVYFQYTFRDPGSLNPGSSGAGFNYSDALGAVFCP